MQLPAYSLYVLTQRWLPAHNAVIQLIAFVPDAVEQSWSRPLGVDFLFHHRGRGQYVTAAVVSGQWSLLLVVQLVRHLVLLIPLTNSADRHAMYRTRRFTCVRTMYRTYYYSQGTRWVAVL